MEKDEEIERQAHLIEQAAKLKKAKVNRGGRIFDSANH